MLHVKHRESFVKSWREQTVVNISYYRISLNIPCCSTFQVLNEHLIPA